MWERQWKALMILMLPKLQNLGTSRSRSLGIFYELDPDLKPACEENLAAECNATLEIQQNIPVLGSQGCSLQGKTNFFFYRKEERFLQQIFSKKRYTNWAVPTIGGAWRGTHTSLSTLANICVQKMWTIFQEHGDLDSSSVMRRKKAKQSRYWLMIQTGNKLTRAGRTHTHDDRLTDPYEVHTGCIRGSIPWGGSIEASCSATLHCSSFAPRTCKSVIESIGIGNLQMELHLSAITHWSSSPPIIYFQIFFPIFLSCFVGHLVCIFCRSLQHRRKERRGNQILALLCCMIKRSMEVCGVSSCKFFEVFCWIVCWFCCCRCCNGVWIEGIDCWCRSCYSCAGAYTDCFQGTCTGGGGPLTRNPFCNLLKWAWNFGFLHVVFQEDAAALQKEL